MKTVATIDAGICGFQTQITAEGDDLQMVTFEVATGCERIRAYAAALAANGPVDGYGELAAGNDGVVLREARIAAKNLCAGCAVPMGAFKAMQVAAGVALPKDVTIKIRAE